MGKEVSGVKCLKTYYKLLNSFYKISAKGMKALQEYFRIEAKTRWFPFIYTGVQTVPRPHYQKACGLSSAWSDETINIRSTICSRMSSAIWYRMKWNIGKESQLTELMNSFVVVLTCIEDCEIVTDVNILGIVHHPETSFWIEAAVLCVEAKHLRLYANNSAWRATQKLTIFLHVSDISFWADILYF